MSFKEYVQIQSDLFMLILIGGIFVQHKSLYRFLNGNDHGGNTGGKDLDAEIMRNVRD
jgi:hypothetical protein